MKKSSISLGTIIFWGFLAWVWFGEDIAAILSDNINLSVKVNGEQVVDFKAEIKDAIDEAKTAFNEVKGEVEKEIELRTSDDKDKPKPEPEKPKRERTMVAEPEQNSNDRFSRSDDLYGDSDSKW